MQQAKAIGDHCALIIDDLINHQTKDLLRQAQGIENVVFVNNDLIELKRKIYQGGAKYQRQSKEFIH